MAKFADVPGLTYEGDYLINVPWTSIERVIQEYEEDQGLGLNPDFQRGHVWNEKHQIRYVEYVLRGGRASRELKFNGEDFGSENKKPIQIVDGLQRLTAVRRFLNNEIPAFGHYYQEFEDKPDRAVATFEVRINNLPTRDAVLQWYLDLNDGGTVHSPEEIMRVRKLLAKEQGRALDYFSIYVIQDNRWELVQAAAAEPYTNVEVFEMTELEAATWGDGAEAGWYWQRRDRSGFLSGPFPSSDEALKDFKVHYDDVPTAVAAVMLWMSNLMDHQSGPSKEEAVH